MNNEPPDLLNILKRFSWFGDLPPGDLTLLLQCADKRWYPRGSIVFYQGDPGDYLLLVLKGRLQILVIEADGSETILRELGEGEALGELSLLDDLNRSATAKAVERSQVLRIPRAPFIALLERRPKMAIKILVRVAADLRRATEHIRTLTLPDLRGQVVRCLIQIALDRGMALHEPIEIRPQPSRLDIAKRIGCRPESVSRAMKELCAAEFVRKEKGAVLVEARAIRRYW